MGRRVRHMPGSRSLAGRCTCFIDMPHNSLGFLENNSAESLPILYSPRIRLAVVERRAVSERSDRRFGDSRCWPRPQLVGGFQSFLPSIEIHRRELRDIGIFDEQIERLALIDIRTSISCHIDQ